MFTGNRALPHSHNVTFNVSDCGVVSEHCEDMMEGIAVWAVFSFLFSLVGFPACVAVLWELFQRHKAGTHFTPNDIFMLNLTTMDLVFLFFIPFGVCNFLLWNVRPFQKFTDILYALNLVGRPLFTACICLDCHLAVVHPVIYRTKKSLTPRVLMCAGVWTATVAQGIVFATIDELNHSGWTTIMYVLALPIIVISDVSVFWTLKRFNPGGGDLHPRKRKALQIITNSMVMTITSYIPPVLGLILGEVMMSDKRQYECFVAIPVLITPTAGSAIMPVLYLGNLGKLKKPCFLA